MASVVTSFQDMSQINSAVATLNTGYSIDNALTWGQSAFDRAYYWTPSAYTYTSSTQVSVRYANGDTATAIGSNMTSTTPYMTRLDYHFSTGENVVLLGSVSKSYSGALSGSINQMTVSKSNLGSISVYGNANVAGTGGTLSKVVWDVNGVHLEEYGSLSASIWVSGGYYHASHSGSMYSGILTAGGLSLQANGFNIDSNTPASSGELFLQILLSGNDTVAGSGVFAGVYGYVGDDRLTGTSGNDFLVGGSGNDTIDGGSGFDVATFSGNRANYTITKTGSTFTVSANSGTDGTDTVTNVEYLQFADKAITISPANTFDEYTALLYQGALGRTPDSGGLAGWITLTTALPAATQALGVYGLSDASGNFNGNMSITAGFTNSPEFIAKYGSLTNEQFVTQLYANILDRTPDSAGLAGWQSILTGGATREHLLVGFALSQEAISNATVGYVGIHGQHEAWLMLS